MAQDFALPAGALGRFAVVKLWPHLQSAEDECIARLKLAASKLGLECIEILEDGRALAQPNFIVSRENVDFVIHLHYDTPKRYDAFSFVALWNPTHFYHMFGYERCSRNLVTHDDFLSCSSPAADDHVWRIIRSHRSHLAPRFVLYHSTPDVTHAPTLGEGKLFYCGINWDRLRGGKSRHQEILDELDKTGELRIFGPKIFEKVEVWKGYQGYVGEIAFDGHSLIEQISRAGIALVLSSEAHKDAGLMSNRLFESLASGALIICDENPFGQKHFGDTLLYVDTTANADEVAAKIIGHRDWAQQNPGQALEMIGAAQKIFRDRFTLSRNLGDIYVGLAERKRAIKEERCPTGGAEPRVKLWLLMPDYSPEVLQVHIESIRAQEYTNLVATLVIGREALATHETEIKRALSESSSDIKIRPTDFVDPLDRKKWQLGKIVLELVNCSREADALMIVAPNEAMFSDHVTVLAGAMARDRTLSCAATAAILLNGSEPVNGVHELLDFNGVGRIGPTGYGRFIFRLASIPDDVSTALPYVNSRPLAILIGTNKIHQLLPATITIDVPHGFFPPTWDEGAENAVIADYCPEVLNVSQGFFARRVFNPQPEASPTKKPKLLKRFRRAVRARVATLVNFRASRS